MPVWRAVACRAPPRRGSLDAAIVARCDGIRPTAAATSGCKVVGAIPAACQNGTDGPAASNPMSTATTGLIRAVRSRARPRRSCVGRWPGGYRDHRRWRHRAGMRAGAARRRTRRRRARGRDCGLRQFARQLRNNHAQPCASARRARDDRARAALDADSGRAAIPEAALRSAAVVLARQVRRALQPARLVAWGDREAVAAGSIPAGDAGMDRPASDRMRVPALGHAACLPRCARAGRLRRGTPRTGANREARMR